MEKKMNVNEEIKRLVVELRARSEQIAPKLSEIYRQIIHDIGEALAKEVGNLPPENFKILQSQAYSLAEFLTETEDKTVGTAINKAAQDAMSKLIDSIKGEEWGDDAASYLAALKSISFFYDTYLIELKKRLFEALKSYIEIYYTNAHGHNSSHFKHLLELIIDGYKDGSFFLEGEVKKANDIKIYFFESLLSKIEKREKRLNEGVSMTGRGLTTIDSLPGPIKTKEGEKKEFISTEEEKHGGRYTIPVIARYFHLAGIDLSGLRRESFRGVAEMYGYSDATALNKAYNKYRKKAQRIASSGERKIHYKNVVSTYDYVIKLCERLDDSEAKEKAIEEQKEAKERLEKLFKD